MTSTIKHPRSRVAVAVPAPARGLQAWLLCGLLFCSGAAGLVYQVLWVKQLSLVVGVEVYAVTIAISAFFAGLAAGALLFGHYGDRIARPILLYAALEAVVALLGLGATLAFPWAAQAFARLEALAGMWAWSLPFALVGVPALFMGGTLPVLVRALGGGDSQLGQDAGRLYAANTAGAIAGTLLAALLLIALLGVRGTALVAAGLNLLAAFGALYLARPGAALPPQPEAGDAPVPGARLALALYGVAGGVALGYEVVWSQAIVPFMSTRAVAFAVVLATYLAGLALGSALYARHAHRLQDAWGSFGLLISLAGLLAVAQVAGLGGWLVVLQSRAEALALGVTGSNLAGMCARFALAALWVVLLPTVLLGAAFPLTLRLVQRGAAGRRVGGVLAVNTVGGIVGVMLSGFVLVPLLGLVRSLALLASMAAVLGLIAVWRGPGVAKRSKYLVTATALGTLGLGLWMSPAHLAQLLPGARQGHMVYYQEGSGGTVAVVEQGKGGKRFRRLYIQGVSNTGDAMPSLRYMRLQALIPLLIHRGTPRSALVIGFGTGITAGAMLTYPGLERPVVAELLPQVLQAAPLFSGNFDAVNDPRLDIRLRDGRRELLRSEQRYDLITLEPPPPSAAGVVNLYSSDFYRLAASRLETDGLVAQWLPLPTQNDEDSRSLVRSFIDVFPYATLWTTELHEMLMIGSLQPLVLDVPRIRQRFEQPQARLALAQVGIDSPAALLATWVTDRAGLERYAGNARAVTDDQPRIEYAPWVRAKEITRVLPLLLALRSDPPLANAGPAFSGEVRDNWQQLRLFYEVGLHAYNGNRNAWQQDASRLLREDAHNPYYQWFLGGR
jgi:predicted membrane-bound spermidine synthase